MSSPRRRRRRAAATTIAAATILVAGAIIHATSSEPSTHNAPGGVYTSSTTLTPTMVPSLCHSINGRADHTCTPGLAAHRPEVAADEKDGYIHTLCQPEGVRPRWTDTIRPPTTTTNKWKLEVMNAYGFRNTSADDVEGDHLLSLILDGDDGSTRGPLGLSANFYPQIKKGTFGAFTKDNEERGLHRQVCDHAQGKGGLTLQQAQEKLLRDWTH